MQTMMMIRSSNSDNPAVSIDSGKRKNDDFLVDLSFEKLAYDPKKRKGK